MSTPEQRRSFAPEPPETEESPELQKDSHPESLPTAPERNVLADYKESILFEEKRRWYRTQAAAERRTERPNNFKELYSAALRKAEVMAEIRANHPDDFAQLDRYQQIQRELPDDAKALANLSPTYTTQEAILEEIRDWAELEPEQIS